MSTGLCVDKVIQIDPVITPIDPTDPGAPPTNTNTISTCNIGLYTTSSVEKCLKSSTDNSAVE